MSLNKYSVAVLTVTYGNRWIFLSQLVDRVMEDERTELVIVDNASLDRDIIAEGVKKYGKRVTILRQADNIGSAGGFAKGLEYAKTLDHDFILLLDDDNLPEEKAISKYISRYELRGKGNIIICGNRVDLKGSQVIFDGSEVVIEKSHTFFSVFSLAKWKRFFTVLVGQSAKKSFSKLRVDSVEIYAFGYGGAFIPKQGVVEAPLPTAALFTYGDDMEYSWGLVECGYRCFLERDIAIHDVDLTFTQHDTASHIVDLLLPSTTDRKVFYRMRNGAYLSRKYSDQSDINLIASIIVWYCGLLLLFVIKKRFFGVFQIQRALLVARALVRGYRGNLERHI